MTIVSYLNAGNAQKLKKPHGVTDGQKKAPYNVTFGILSALAIIMVVAGHAGYDILTVGGLFPYYSFHVPLFMFISGYFYRGEEEERPFLYLKKKVRRLLLPYFIWNVVYGVIAWALRAFCGFSIGEKISLKTLVISPFLHGHQFLYNLAAWFVPALFLIETANLCMRLVLKKLRLYDERLILVCSLAVGICVVQLSIYRHVWGVYQMPGRLLFLYPCFQMGQFYKKKLESRDTLGNGAYFVVVLTIQLLLHLSCNGLAYSSVWCRNFANGPVIPYVTAVSGIAFWLRVAKILAPLVGERRSDETAARLEEERRRGLAAAQNPADGFLLYLGRNTYAVMMHHFMAFMLVKMVLAGIAAHTGYLADFDFAQFYGDINYYYIVKGSEAFHMVYLAAGVLLPLLLQRALDVLLPAARRIFPALGRGGLFGRP